MSDEPARPTSERTAELLKSIEDLAVFRRLVEASSQGIGMADLDGRITYVNPALCRLLGEDKPEDMIGLSADDYYPEEYRGRREKELLPAIIDTGTWSVELTMCSRQGKLIPALHDAFLVRDAKGNPFRVAVAIIDMSEQKQAQESLARERQTLWHMLQASDHERRLIAYEIHDGLTQQVAAAIMQFQAYKHLREQPEKARQAFDAGVEMLHVAYSEARRLISGVRPPVLDEAGVETAIAHLVHDGRVFKGPKIEYQSDVAFDRLPAILENALYRIAQEALANACKHSQSDRIRVRLAELDNSVQLEVQDWGIGFDPPSSRDGHFGLEGIRERVRLLGGELVIDSVPGRGTLLRVAVPLLEREGPAVQ